MSSMRVDGGASAALWAKRLRKLVEHIEDDGGLVFINIETNDIAVDKNGQTFTMSGEDVTGEL